MVEIGEFFDNMAKFTKCYVVLSLFLGGLIFLRLMPVTWVLVYTPHELWNPKVFLSFVFLGKLSLSLIFELYFFTIVCTRLEESYRPKRYADFFVMILFIAVMTILCETLINWNGYALLSKAFVMALTYIFCKRNPNERMRLIFIFEIKAAYFPFALLVLELLEGGSVWSGLVGIGIGHVFVYFKDVLPAAGKPDFLRTPRWANTFLEYLGNTKLPVIGQGGVQDVFQDNRNRVFQGRGVRIG